MIDELEIMALKQRVSDLEEIVSKQSQVMALMTEAITRLAPSDA